MGQIVGIAIVWFIIEMLVWYLIAQFTSGWLVFMWFIIAAVIGISLIRKGMVALNPMAQQMKAGGMMNPAMRPQESTMLKSVAMAVAGILLLIPGVISDVLALLVVLPPVQKLPLRQDEPLHRDPAHHSVRARALLTPWGLLVVPVRNRVEHKTRDAHWHGSSLRTAGREFDSRGAHVFSTHCLLLIHWP
ncbi:FxsA family protein [uncultured Psychrobacter sp.]|uniref:FxsA family protein n=1 Tax=uncultured Psychrobacter sp. TaxID=259303 RepID=UPI0032B2C1CC